MRTLMNRGLISLVAVLLLALRINCHILAGRLHICINPVVV